MSISVCDEALSPTGSQTQLSSYPEKFTDHSADPWGGNQCQDPTCPVCCTEGNMGKSLCKVTNLVYKNTCVLCQEQGKESIYLGESSRSLGERSQEHEADYYNPKKQETSHLARHMTDMHPGVEMKKNSYSIVKRCSTALSRQVRETVEIKLHQDRGANITNSKIEYNRCMLPTLVVLGP